MSDCLFCKIVSGEAPSHLVYENEHIFAFLNISPYSVGHTLIVPKVHAENLAAGTVDEARELMAAVHLLGDKLMSALGATGYNLGMNNGEIAGQVIMHTHLHLMPRYAGEKRSFTKIDVTPEELAATAEKIRAVVESK